MAQMSTMMEEVKALLTLGNEREAQDWLHLLQCPQPAWS